LGLAFLVFSFFLGSPAFAENVIKLGVSTPLSGAASVWGLTQVWAAKESVRRVNEAGGITVQGKKYTFEVIAYDNKYTSAEGATVANKLVFDDKIHFMIATLGSAPTLAMQAITEPQKILTFSTAWSRKSKGPKKPYTFTQINTPTEIYPALVPWIQNKYPNAKRVACIGPNDATGWDAVKVAIATWKKAGLNVVKKEYYERGTTEFYPIVTKLKASKPDILDISTAPPGEAALILKGLKEQGWSGIKMIPGMMGLKKFVEAAGADVAEGTYLGLTPDFTGPLATPTQKELYELCYKEKNVPLDAVAMGSYDALQALLAAIKFGSADLYGTPCQILIPIRITQIQNGKGIDVAVSQSPELSEKLNKLGVK
jgi:branched-chain amino acid transport system substrate-binding protein